MVSEDILCPFFGGGHDRSLNSKYTLIYPHGSDNIGFTVVLIHNGAELGVSLDYDCANWRV